MQQERHTCSEISYRITDVECIARAKTLQLDLTGTIRMIRNEKLCEGNLSTSLLEGPIGSDAAQTFIIDRILFQMATTVQKIESTCRF